MNSTYKPDCILHIGMPKTGSSSIQKTLHTLVTSEFEYLSLSNRDGNLTGLIMTAFAEKPELCHNNIKMGLTKNQALEIQKKYIAELKTALKASQSKTIIISAEGIVYLNENELLELREFLLQYCRSIQVIGYVRPPIAYMQSALQELTKNGAPCPFASEALKPNYRNSFEKCDRIFGKNVLLLKYDRSTLLNKDVVLDFCYHTNIPLNPDSIIRVNKSISLEALSLLYVYYRLGVGYGSFSGAMEENELLVKAVSQIGNKKIHFSAGLSNWLLEKNLSDIQWMETRLGCSLAESLEDSTDSISSEDDLFASSTIYAEDLKQLILCKIPEQAVTPQKIADWMHLLRQQLSHSKTNQSQGKTAFSTPQIEHLKAKESLLQEKNKIVHNQNAKSSKKFRLIVHIGASMTGTSSIQEALQIQQKELIEQSFWYLGRMLEHAPVKRYAWQRASAFEELMSLSESEITAQLDDVLSSSIDKMISAGCKTAILSNESFFNRPKVHRAVIPVFEQLAANGWKIDIIAYVRRHDAWLQSAYTQWGLKHKTYQGPLLPFSKWINQFDFVFTNSLRWWLTAKGCKSFVRNFDATADVVGDFYAILGASQKEIGKAKVNESPSLEELLLRSLFNNQIQAPALPFEFDRLMGVANLDFNRSATTFLSSYLPTDEDMIKIVNDCAEDRAEINRILKETGQPPIDTSVLKSKPIEVDLAKLIAIMFEILTNQARKIELLESNINKLTISFSD